MSAEPNPQVRRIPFVVRHRTGLTWIPAALYLAAIVLSRGSLTNSALHLLMEQVGFALIGACSIGRIWCGIYIAGRKNKELCQDGPYSLCRNPLYAFSYLGTVGIALGAQVWWLALVVTPPFWTYYYLVIKNEEEKLRRIFGAEFDAYRARVPMIWPRFSNYWSRKEFTIHPEKVVRAVVEASWFLWIIVFLEIVEALKAVWYRSAL